MSPDNVSVFINASQAKEHCLEIPDKVHEFTGVRRHTS